MSEVLSPATYHPQRQSA